jgi:hypothetical protein
MGDKMNYYTALVTATLIDVPKEKKVGKGQTPRFETLKLDTRLEKEILPPEALDTTDFFAVEPVTVAALWIEKICKVEFLMTNIEADNISGVEEVVRQVLKANKNTAKVKDIEITSIKKQADYE